MSSVPAAVQTARDLVQTNWDAVGSAKSALVTAQAALDSSLAALLVAEQAAYSAAPPSAPPAPVLAPSTTVVSSSPGASGVSKLSARVSGAAGVADAGLVTFLDGANVLGVAPVYGGLAVFSAILSPGVHSLTASYAPPSVNPYFAPSTSAPLSVTV